MSYFEYYLNDQVSTPYGTNGIYDNTLPILQATMEGLQAPHEHFSVYDQRVHYPSQVNEYQDPQHQNDYGYLLRTTPTLYWGEEQLFEAQPRGLSIQAAPLSQDLFDELMKAAADWSAGDVAPAYTGAEGDSPAPSVPMDQGIYESPTENIDSIQPNLEAIVQDVPVPRDLPASDMISDEIHQQMQPLQADRGDWAEPADDEHAQTLDQHIQAMEDHDVAAGV